MRNFIRETLSKYIPAETVETLTDWILDYKIKVKITRSRHTKFGDYRAPQNGHGHRITINHDLNKYAFLITFIHEVAHLVVREKYKRSVAPHGNEWKHEFKVLLHPFLNHHIFPEDVLEALKKYFLNPAASSCTDVNLYRSLKKYNHHNPSSLHLEELPEQSIFQLSNGMIFKKGKLLRKRFECFEIKTKKIYLVSPVAEVELCQNKITKN